MKNQELLHKICKLISNDKHIYPNVPEYDTVIKIIELCSTQRSPLMENKELLPSYRIKQIKNQNLHMDWLTATHLYMDEQHKLSTPPIASDTNRNQCADKQTSTPKCEHEWAVNSFKEIQCRKCGEVQEKEPMKECEHDWQKHPLTNTNWCIKCHLGHEKYKSEQFSGYSTETPQGINEPPIGDEVAEIADILIKCYPQTATMKAKRIIDAGFSKNPPQTLVRLDDKLVFEEASCVLRKYFNDDSSLAKGALIADHICARFGTPAKGGLSVEPCKHESGIYFKEINRKWCVECGALGYEGKYQLPTRCHAELQKSSRS